MQLTLSLMPIDPLECCTFEENTYIKKGFKETKQKELHVQLARNIQWLHCGCCKTAKASVASQRTLASYMMLASSHPVAFSVLMLQAILKNVCC